MAHVFRPRFGTESADTQLKFIPRQSRIDNCIGQIKCIRRGTTQHGSSEIVHQRNLFCRISAGHGDDRSTDILSSGMGSQTARKQAIAIRHLENVRLAGPIGGEGTRQAFGPDRQILAGVAHYSRLARGARRGMNAHNLTHRYGTKTERIIVPQVIFSSKRQFYNIVNALNVIGSDTQLLHFPTIKGGVMINSFHRLVKTDALNLTKTRPVHTLDTFVPNHVFLWL